MADNRRALKKLRAKTPDEQVDVLIRKTYKAYRRAIQEAVLHDGRPDLFGARELLDVLLDRTAHQPLADRVSALCEVGSRQPWSPLVAEDRALLGAMLDGVKGGSGALRRAAKLSGLPEDKRPAFRPLACPDVVAQVLVVDRELADGVAAVRGAIGRSARKRARKSVRRRACSLASGLAMATRTSDEARAFAVYRGLVSTLG